MKDSMQKMGFAAIGVLSLALAFAITSGAEEARTEPDATLKFSGGTVAVGAGYTWGSGLLTYKGKEYKFKIDGLPTTALGAGSIDATGIVYHLKNVQDFAGKYAGVTTAAAMGGGVGFSNMQNGSGVFIQFRNTGVGVLLQAGPLGINVAME